MSDYDKYELNPATMMYAFQIEYRGYQTSAWAGSALGLPSVSFTYDNKTYEIWNRSWAGVDDKVVTKMITSFHNSMGQQTHPEKKPHNPLPD